jgi:hypothetical protein
VLAILTTICVMHAHHTHTCTPHPLIELQIILQLLALLTIKHASPLLMLLAIKLHGHLHPGKVGIHQAMPNAIALDGMLNEVQLIHCTCQPPEHDSVLVRR